MDLSEAIFLDTETTSNDPEKHTLEVIELAQIRMRDLAQVGKGSHQRFSPEGMIQWGALATHNILMSDLKDCPPSATAPANVWPAKYWIGHNIDFDWMALGSPPGIKRICTLAMSRFLWPALDSHKLGAVAYFALGANHNTRNRLLAAHNATVDVEICIDILLQMLRTPQMQGIDTIEKLYTFSEEARIPTHWSFGKFIGQPISAADRGYAQWYKTKHSNPDPYYLEALRRARLL